LKRRSADARLNTDSHDNYDTNSTGGTGENADSFGAQAAGRGLSR
jgi:hypothetical protein